jgi:hypothetical protein
MGRPIDIVLFIIIISFRKKKKIYAVIRIKKICRPLYSTSRKMFLVHSQHMNFELLRSYLGVHRPVHVILCKAQSVTNGKSTSWACHCSESINVTKSLPANLVTVLAALYPRCNLDPQSTQGLLRLQTWPEGTNIYYQHHFLELVIFDDI